MKELRSTHCVKTKTTHISDCKVNSQYSQWYPLHSLQIGKNNQQVCLRAAVLCKSLQLNHLPFGNWDEESLHGTPELQSDITTKLVWLKRFLKGWTVPCASNRFQETNLKQHPSIVCECRRSCNHIRSAINCDRDSATVVVGVEVEAINSSFNWKPSIAIGCIDCSCCSCGILLLKTRWSLSTKFPLRIHLAARLQDSTVQLGQGPRGIQQHRVDVLGRGHPSQPEPEQLRGTTNRVMLAQVKPHTDTRTWTSQDRNHKSHIVALCNRNGSKWIASNRPYRQPPQKPQFGGLLY